MLLLFIDLDPRVGACWWLYGPMTGSQVHVSHSLSDRDDNILVVISLFIYYSFKSIFTYKYRVCNPWCKVIQHITPLFIPYVAISATTPVSAPRPSPPRGIPYFLWLTTIKWTRRHLVNPSLTWQRVWTAESAKQEIQMKQILMFYS